MFKCLTCNRQFIGGDRLRIEEIWHEYLYGKQTLSQLSKKYKKSERTIRRILSKVEIQTPAKQIREIVIVMDTTYWGREFGVMLFKDAWTGENIYKQYVKYETVNLYRQGIKNIEELGFKIRAIVCDGRRGLLGGFGEIPTQMCHFHQIAIITRYLTRKPRTQASRELRQLGSLLPRTDRESFEGSLSEWHSRWEKFLNEQSIDEITNKRSYVHKRLRSAYKSLKKNLPWLFVSYENLHMRIPQTTNSIDGQFADLKNKLRVHNGLRITQKIKMIDEFLKA